MAGQKLRLGLPEVAAEINQRHAGEPDGWRKNRLLVVRLAAQGEHTAAQIADLCGIARGHLFCWMKKVRTGGLEALLTREKPGPREGTRHGLSEEAARELKSKLEAGDFVSAVEAQRWLEEEHSIRKPYQTVWGWLKKQEECCGCRVPVTPEKTPKRRNSFARVSPESLKP